MVYKETVCSLMSKQKKSEQIKALEWTRKEEVEKQLPLAIKNA
jgi:hypothetical protein